jgi:hypothetical protein
MAKYLALGNAALNLIVAGFYAVQGDWRHASYWLFSACIITSVTV